MEINQYVVTNLINVIMLFVICFHSYVLKKNMKICLKNYELYNLYKKSYAALFDFGDDAEHKKPTMEKNK